jgi:hypothetical protein
MQQRQRCGAVLRFVLRFPCCWIFAMVHKKLVPPHFERNAAASRRHGASNVSALS